MLKSLPRCVVACLAASALVSAGVVLVADPATADAPSGVSPVAARSAGGVTADALPTVQMDGVAWSQGIVGNTVWAGGKFAYARPAGAAPGANQTPRNNLLAYNLTTGDLITSIAPDLNAQVKAVAASPDGSRVYVGGQFTTANGQARYRIAAYDATTGALISSFAPGVDSTVNAIAATNTTVYVGGYFTQANGVPRASLAAFNASDGALTSWNPGSSGGEVQALTITPDGQKVVVGGSFTSLAGSPTPGLGAVDTATGLLQTWNVNQVVQDSGPNAAILSLTHDSDGNVYGSGYVYGSGGNLEGAFSANQSNGDINWLEDCHGDTYGVAASPAAVYTVSHAHYCGAVGGFPQSAAPWIEHRSMAFTKNATGTVQHGPFTVDTTTSTAIRARLSPTGGRIWTSVRSPASHRQPGPWRQTASTRCWAGSSPRSTTRHKRAWCALR